MISSNPNSNESGNSIFWDSAPLESSTPLEAPIPLSYREELQPGVPVNATASVPSAVNTMTDDRMTEDRAATDVVQTNELQTNVVQTNELQAQDNLSQASTSVVLEEERIQLLEERLIIDRKKRKVGEIIVRKVIETRMIEVPVRRERLLIEQVGSEHRQLASIDLGQPTSDAVEFVQPSDSTQFAVNGEFTSVKAAAQFLATIATSQPNLGCKAVQIKIVADSAEQQKLYQQWLDRYLESQRSTMPPL